MALKQTIPLEGQIRIIAGVIIFCGTGLGLTVHAWFFAVPMIGSLGLIVSGLTGFCLMAKVLAKMPWNKA